MPPKKPIKKNPLSEAIEQGGVLPEAQPTTAWEEINALHYQCIQLMISCTDIRNLIGNKEMVAKLKNEQEIVSLSNIYLRDMTEFKKKLDDIKKSYEDIPVAQRNTMDPMSTIAVGERYYEWMSKFQAVVLPNAADIFSAFIEVDPSLATD